jgi:hypothetical protein
MREGLTSLAAMLLETSMARMTVASRRGVLTVAIGRADRDDEEGERGSEQRERQVPAPALRPRPGP